MKKNEKPNYYEILGANVLDDPKNIKELYIKKLNEFDSTFNIIFNDDYSDQIKKIRKEIDEKLDYLNVLMKRSNKTEINNLKLELTKLSTYLKNLEIKQYKTHDKEIKKIDAKIEILLDKFISSDEKNKQTIIEELKKLHAEKQELIEEKKYLENLEVEKKIEYEKAKKQLHDAYAVLSDPSSKYYFDEEYYPKYLKKIETYINSISNAVISLVYQDTQDLKKLKNQVYSLAIIIIEYTDKIINLIDGIGTDITPKEYKSYINIYKTDPFLNNPKIKKGLNLRRLNRKYMELYKQLLSKIFELIAYMKYLTFENENIKEQVIKSIIRKLNMNYITFNGEKLNSTEKIKTMEKRYDGKGLL